MKLIGICIEDVGVLDEMFLDEKDAQDYVVNELGYELDNVDNEENLDDFNYFFTYHHINTKKYNYNIRRII